MKNHIAVSRCCCPGPQPGACVNNCCDASAWAWEGRITAGKDLDGNTVSPRLTAYARRCIAWGANGTPDCNQQLTGPVFPATVTIGGDVTMPNFGTLTGHFVELGFSTDDLAEQQPDPVAQTQARISIGTDDGVNAIAICNIQVNGVLQLDAQVSITYGDGKRAEIVATRDGDNYDFEFRYDGSALDLGSDAANALDVPYRFHDPFFHWLFPRESFLDPTNVDYVEDWSTVVTPNQLCGCSAGSRYAGTVRACWFPAGPVLNPGAPATPVDAFGGSESWTVTAGVSAEAGGIWTSGTGNNGGYRWLFSGGRIFLNPRDLLDITSGITISFIARNVGVQAALRYGPMSDYSAPPATTNLDDYQDDNWKLIAVNVPGSNGLECRVQVEGVCEDYTLRGITGPHQPLTTNLLYVFIYDGQGTWIFYVGDTRTGVMYRQFMKIPNPYIQQRDRGTTGPAGLEMNRCIINPDALSAVTIDQLFFLKKAASDQEVSGIGDGTIWNGGSLQTDATKLPNV